MGEWKEYQLDEVIEKFIDYRGKTPTKTTSGVPLITATVVKNGTIEEPNEFISKEDYHSWMRRGYPEVDDVVITTEAPLGEVALLKSKDVALAQRIITLRAYPKKAYNPFIKYYLQSPTGQYELESRASGTTVLGIKSSVLKKLPVIMPDKDEQVAIASVLLSLDNKIDLLHRQNKTLEAMAETLFRQWFVEEAEEGWEEMRLDQFSTVGIGRTPPRKEQHWFSTDSTDVKWISIKDMAAEGPFIFSTAEYLTEEAVERFRVPVIPKDTVVLSFKMTLGRVKITTEAMLSNEAIAHFRIKADSHVTKEYLYLGLKTYQYETLGSTSTIVDSINSGMIREMVLQIPPEPLMNRFMEQCGPWFDKIKSNQLQIQTLTALRDTLLPKLMSGEVRVETVQNHIEA